MAVVKLENVSKSWGDFKAVDDFNLTIEDEEFLVLLGPSGCGKTTTMRMIAGLEELSSGTIKIDDVIVNDLEPKDRDVSMVFQSYGLYPNMSVFENIRFPLKIRKIKKSLHEKLVMRAVKMVELEKFLTSSKILYEDEMLFLFTEYSPGNKIVLILAFFDEV